MLQEHLPNFLPHLHSIYSTADINLDKLWAEIPGGDFFKREREREKRER
jgi:hypothetical protein